MDWLTEWRDLTVRIVLVVTTVLVAMTTVLLVRTVVLPATRVPPELPRLTRRMIRHSLSCNEGEVL